MATTIDHILGRLVALLQTLHGWMVMLGIFFLDYIAGHEFSVCLVVAVTLMDACWGIAVSLKRGKFALSELARLTVAKFAVYGCALLTFIGIDKIADTELVTSVVAAAITLVELWSACGSMLIIFPSMPALKLLRKALTGEIASKLHVEPEEVEQILGEFEKQKKNKE